VKVMAKGYESISSFLPYPTKRSKIVIGKYTRIIRIIVIILAAGAALFLLIQLIPYGHNHTNQAVVSEPKWDNSQTRALAKRACFDCHSNETVWPWYSNIAPVSWLVQKDVNEGRDRFNFSDWQNAYLDDLGEFTEAIEGGGMPPAQYLLLHPNARLSKVEKQQLIDGLSATLK
jgi:cytochrome c551/c552